MEACMMYRVIEKDGQGITASTVGELKRMLAEVPDDYSISVTGEPWAMAVSDEDELVLFDNPDFILDLVEEG